MTAQQDVSTPDVIAVSINEAQEFGCPRCGGIFGSSSMSGGGSQLWNCADCNKTSIYLAEGLTKSTIGISSHYPELQSHPRRGQPVDREKLVRDREERIESRAIAGLSYWLTLGHGHPVKIEKAGSHMSKSCYLPILATESPENVRATWFGDNFHFHFLGIDLKQPIPATLLYPISSIFGRYALSGHTNTEVAPPLTNFQKEYHNNTPVKVFGSDCYGGFCAALVIRYLEEVSKLDIEKILDVCLRKTSYGLVDNIDGNCVKFADLAKLLDLEFAKFAYCDFDVQNITGDIFERVNVDWFHYDLGVGRSSVHITLKEGVLLPPLVSPAEIYVDLEDTLLGRYIPQEIQERPTKNTYSDYLILKVPTRLLHYQRDRAPEEQQKLRGNEKQPVNRVYDNVNIGTRKFTFSVPNVLDCALTAFFFVKVLAPMMQEIQAQ
ncbi:MAG: hypothetical protein U9P90_04450 [Patescibacteria group bacterium]|nr:hypothetical protein [Patescibacteria group bacterium]